MSFEKPAERSNLGGEAPPSSPQDPLPGPAEAAAPGQSLPGAQQAAGSELQQAGGSAASATAVPQQPGPRGGALVIAWIGVALIPFFLVGAFILGYVLTGTLESNSGDDLSIGADVATLLAMLAVFALPCLLAAVAGGRAVMSGDPGGRTPRMIGIGAFIAFAVWGVVSFLWNWLALGIYN